MGLRAAPPAGLAPPDAPSAVKVTCEYAYRRTRTAPATATLIFQAGSATGGQRNHDGVPLVGCESPERWGRADTAAPASAGRPP